ncbi:GNAT family N-acetyltransferase [Portibacter lacus]|uniref:ElaA protein n=1 Tax=Portibacter lacus TaxID=1099794 RepID=A0AA37ST30_9BACT|nr:GNAT family N-acetyltransferase [Portibacter lacus]GLR18156.1 ElaA protein [Portibacter lacus]
MIVFETKPFASLNLDELYRILELRAEVFVVEQDCVYQDLDGKDKLGHHLLGMVNGEIHAYSRILPPGTTFTTYSSIGRILTSMDVRREGYGRSLVTESIKQCHALYPKHQIKISAQTYLLKFYTGLGFNQVGEGYLEDGIPHVGMVYGKPS